MDNVKPQENKLEARLKLIGVIVTVASLLFAIAQFTWNQSVEAAKPYLQKKLQWCEDAVDAASFIATADAATTSAATLGEKKQKFSQMYWGVMGMIENASVSKAMSDFNTALNNKDEGRMKEASIALARACRQEMADSWSPIWKPYWR